MAKEHYTETTYVTESGVLYLECRSYDTDGVVIKQDKRPCSPEESTAFKAGQLVLADNGLQRLAEDIWAVLKAKNLVSDADLPKVVAGRLKMREGLRKLK